MTAGKKHKDRRNYKRESASIPLRIAPEAEAAANPDCVTGWTMDVSMGGVLLECPKSEHLLACDELSLYAGPPQGSPETMTRLGTARIIRTTTHNGNLQLATELVDKPCHGLYAPMMLGFAPEMVDAKMMLERIISCDFNILINGETGVGKNLFADCIHRYSRGEDKPFMRVNCASIPHTLFESQLFGHEKGAFTDARNAAPGYFRLAGDGTILLDEISEMPVLMQAKLLRVLEEKEFMPVGGKRSVPVRCRIVATSNADLEKRMSEGTFRTDLYCRIALAPVRRPSLRERRVEIPLLAQYLHRYHALRMGKRYEALKSDQLQELAARKWPGNVRELNNYVKHQILMDSFAAHALRRDAGVDSSERAARGILQNTDFSTVRDLQAFTEQVVADAESRAIRYALHEFSGNRTKAAQRLGVSYRTLLRKIERYKIKV